MHAPRWITHARNNPERSSEVHDIASMTCGKTSDKSSLIHVDTGVRVRVCLCVFVFVLCVFVRSRACVIVRAIVCVCVRVRAKDTPFLGEPSPGNPSAEAAFRFSSERGSQRAQLYQ